MFEIPYQEDKEYKMYRVHPLTRYRPDGTNYHTYAEAKAAAERFAEKEGGKWFIYEVVEVVNTVGEVDGGE